MKILVVHNHYRYFGGEDTVVQSEINMLKKNGHEVVVYERSNKFFQELSFIQRIKFYLVDLFWNRRVYRDIVGLIQKERPDIAHIHNTFFALSPSCYDACYGQGIPIVQTVHNYRFLCLNGVFYRKKEICEECQLTVGVNSIKKKCYRNCFWASLAFFLLLRFYRLKKVFQKKITLFVAPSQFTKSKLMQHKFVSEKRIVVKENFLDFDPLPREIVGEYVLFVGTLTEYKGIETLLKAWEQIKELPLCIVGAGPLQKEVAHRIKGIKNVKYLGSKTLEETISLIKGSAFVVVPSECYETFSRIIIEAYACGVPVVASDVGAVKERVKEGNTGVSFSSGDASDLRNKVQELFRQKMKIKRMGELCREEFQKKYLASVNYQGLIKVYNQAIAFKKAE